MGKETLEVVKGVDLKRYMGLWYEIASMPCLFQPRNGINTTAKYTLNEDGTVHVLNETYTNGKKSSIEGTAYKADPKSEEAKLKLKFRPLIPVYGNYWILLLDDDYQWALIGEPTRKYLWVRIFSPIYHYGDLLHCLIVFLGMEATDTMSIAGLQGTNLKRTFISKKHRDDRDRRRRRSIRTGNKNPAEH